MKGVILGLDMETGGLTILGHDDKRYHLQKSEWRSANEPKAGMEIDFMPSGDNSAKEVYCFRSCVENRGDASRKSAPSDGLVQDASPREWFYALKNTQCGPVSEQSLIDRIKSKELTAMTPIWTKGMPKWVLIKNTDFSAYLHQSDSDQGDLLVDQRGVQTQPVVQIADNGAAPPTSESESSTQWYYAVDDNRHGPVPEQNLIDKIKSGELGRNSKIWKEGLPRWILVENSDFKKYCPTIGPPLLDAPDDPKSHSPGKRESTLEEIQKLICTISGLPPLENFRWRNLFSQALKFKGREEMDRYFNCGCSRTTPTLAEIQVRWPQPWAFSQVLLLGLLVLAGFYVCVAWFQNPLAGPGLVLVGAFAVPLACVVLFFEINILRNISMFQIAKLILIGGVVSLIFSLILYGITNLQNTFLGATAAGIVEESGKLLTAIFLMGRIRDFKWILNGLLIGASIGAGFAGFESAGYVVAADHPYEVLSTRAFFSPFCHVVWTASAVGALWKTKGDDPFSFEMLLRKDFLRIFAFVVVLHMLWDSGLLWLVPSGVGLTRLMFFFWTIMTVGSWYLALTLAQAGFTQIQAAQQSALAPKPNTQNQTVV